MLYMSEGNAKWKAWESWCKITLKVLKDWGRNA